MKPKVLLVVILMTVTFMSCVTSIHPLFSSSNIETDVITDDRIIGSWKDDDQEYMVQAFFKSDFFGNFAKGQKDNSGKPTESEKRDSLLFSRSYMINYIKNGIKYELFGNMTRLNGQVFMNFMGINVQNADTNSKNDEIKLPNRIESFTIARLKVINTNTIKLDFINGDFLYKQINAGRMKIKHESDELYETFLITASTNELRSFIEKYANDDRFFDKENSVTLIRKS